MASPNNTNKARPAACVHVHLLHIWQAFFFLNSSTLPLYYSTVLISIMYIQWVTRLLTSITVTSTHVYSSSKTLPIIRQSRELFTGVKDTTRLPRKQLSAPASIKGKHLGLTMLLSKHSWLECFVISTPDHSLETTHAPCLACERRHTLCTYVHPFTSR